MRLGCVADSHNRTFQKGKHMRFVLMNKPRYIIKVSGGQNRFRAAFGTMLWTPKTATGTLLGRRGPPPGPAWEGPESSRRTPRVIQEAPKSCRSTSVTPRAARNVFRTTFDGFGLHDRTRRCLFRTTPANVLSMSHVCQSSALSRQRTLKNGLKRRKIEARGAPGEVRTSNIEARAKA